MRILTKSGYSWRSAGKSFKTFSLCLHVAHIMHKNPHCLYNHFLMSLCSTPNINHEASSRQCMPDRRSRQLLQKTRPNSASCSKQRGKDGKEAEKIRNAALLLV